MTLDVLKPLQAGFAQVNLRLDRIEEGMRKQRRDTAGLLVMAKSVTGDFAEELVIVQKRVTALEGRFP